MHHSRALIVAASASRTPPEAKKRAVTNARTLAPCTAWENNLLANRDFMSAPPSLIAHHSRRSPNKMSR